MTQGRDPGREFDLRMASYLSELRQAWTSRRGFLKLAAGSAGAATLTAALGGASAAASKRLLPGLYVLAQDATIGRLRTGRRRARPGAGPLLRLHRQSGRLQHLRGPDDVHRRTVDSSP